ncbi:methyl-accepting chemotaxis protein [Brachyspira alvinipulli]|uniref:methyl-accepting chemotaxis protein n=1 Tax=Brachyspira alvinipulli TaxID=84379 RepID=UPI0004B01D89|nr:cache domain-containing protein [Brachyspira alvinipulli]
MKNHAKEFVDVYFGNTIPYNQGGVFATALPDSFPENYDQTSREWYIGAVNTNDVFITDPYIDIFTSSLVVTLSKAIKNPDGSLKGVAGLDVLASKINELMNLKKDSSGYEFYMVLSNGKYMSHTNKEYLLNDRYLIFNIPEFMNLKNSLDSNGEAISIYRKKWYVLKQIEGFPWYVAANGNIDKLNDKVNRLIIYIVFFIILFIALETVLVTFITMPITNTLNSAISHIEKMALGNFDTKENIAQNRNNIAYALSSSIDNMQKNISSVIYNLKLDIDSINDEMEKISFVNNDLSDKTISQSSSINELASSIEFLSSAIADTYNNTNNAKEVSKKALE